MIINVILVVVVVVEVVGHTLSVSIKLIFS